MANRQERGFLHFVFWFIGGVIIGGLWQLKLLFGVIWLILLLALSRVSTTPPTGTHPKGPNSIETCRGLAGAALLIWLVLRLRRLVINSREVDGYAASDLLG